TTADKGLHRFKVTLKTAGSQNVIVNRLGAPAGSDAVLVTPAAVHHLKLTTSAGPVAGAAFDVTVAAVDVYGNTVPTYQGTVHFAANDTAAYTVPADYTLLPGDNGTATFAGGATLLTAGTRTISATATGGLQGTATVNLLAAAATKL